MAFRVLIADDSAPVRVAVGMLFRRIGEWEILEASNGVEALAKADECKPDLIILDFAMPRMDGLEASRALQERLPQIPIVLYTLHYSDQLRRDAQAAGVRKLISKSDTGELVATVQELTASRGPTTKHAAGPSICTRKSEEATSPMPAARIAS